MKKHLNKKIAAHLLVFIFLVVPLFVFADNNEQSRFIKCDGPDCDFADLETLVIEVIKFLVQLGIAFSVVIFAWAGWLYMTSGGDSGKVKEAHDLFVRVLWGFLIMLGAVLIVNLILVVLGADTRIINISS